MPPYHEASDSRGSTLSVGALFLVSVLVLSPSAQAEEVELSDGTTVDLSVSDEFGGRAPRSGADRPNAVTTGVAGLGVQWWNLAYRRVLSDSVAIRLGPSYLRVQNEDQTVRMTSLHLGVDYQFAAAGLTGPYLGGQLQYGVAQVETVDDVLLVGSQNERSSYLAFGPVGGYRWVWGPGIVFGAGAGLAFVSTLEQRSSNIFIQGVVPLVDLHLGYAF